MSSTLSRLHTTTKGRIDNTGDVHDKALKAEKDIKARVSRSATPTYKPKRAMQAVVHKPMIH